MSKKASPFGQPKPLPGQPGYKISASELLEKESSEMEIRLKMLQEKIKQQQEMDNAEPKKGGARWKSARNDRGSVTAYAKDVQDKHKLRMTNMMQAAGLNMNETVDPATIRVPAMSRSPDSGADLDTIASSKTPSSSSGKGASSKPSMIPSFAEKGVADWTIQDVVYWLEAQNLGQYGGTFAQNEITGPIVLDLSLTDLDYMGMSVLGHRKILLKNTEDLRSHGRMTAEPARAASGINAGAAVSKSQNSSMLQGLQSKDSPNKILHSQTTDDIDKPPVHWSHLEPLSSKQVSGDAAYDVNGADASYPSGILDEAAEQEAFRLAVLEWRNGSSSSSSSSSGGKTVIIREWEQNKASRSASGAAASNNNTSTSRVSGAIGGGAANGGGGGLWNNPFASSNNKSDLIIDDDDDVDATSNNIDSGIKAPGRGPGDPSLAVGQLDEESEHAEFVKAVEAWRTGKTSGANSAAVQSIVEKLNTAFDLDQQESQYKLQQERDLAMQKIASLKQHQSSTADAKLTALATSSSGSKQDDQDALSEYEYDDGCDYDEDPAISAVESSYSAHKAPSATVYATSESKQHTPTKSNDNPTHSVEFHLVESSLVRGAKDIPVVAENQEYYVEECDD